jgi:hypothetical protein
MLQSSNPFGNEPIEIGSSLLASIEGQLGSHNQRSLTPEYAGLTQLSSHLSHTE